VKLSGTSAEKLLHKKHKEKISQKTQRKFKRKILHVQSFVKLCDSFVELGEIDIPQKTQRKKTQRKFIYKM
jgi:hypothetical protein